MEFKLDGDSPCIKGMKACRKTMSDVFGGSIHLTGYQGPEQMCVFCLEYHYMPCGYQLVFECGRGLIPSTARNREGDGFSPWMIYPQAR